MDIPATARVVSDPTERRPFIEAAAKRWGRTDVEEMLQHSQLIMLTLPRIKQESPISVGGGPDS